MLENFLQFMALLESECQKAGKSFDTYDDHWAASMGFLLNYRVHVNPTESMIIAQKAKEAWEKECEARKTWPWYKKAVYYMIHGELY